MAMLFLIICEPFPLELSARITHVVVVPSTLIPFILSDEGSSQRNRELLVYFVNCEREELTRPDMSLSLPVECLSAPAIH